MEQFRFVGRNESFERLFGDGQEILEDEGSLGDHFVERLALEELHHHVGTLFVLSDIEDAHDVWRTDGRKRMALLHDSLVGVPALSVIGKETFNRDATIQVTVVGTIDRSPATLADLPSNFVAFCVLHRRAPLE